MQIYIAKSGKKTGPFSEEQIKSMLNSGMITLTNFAWHKGSSEWLPLQQVLNVSQTIPIQINPTQLPPPPQPTQAANRYTGYNEVPFYRKQWFFWVMYFTLTPIAIGILLFGDVYYEKQGKVKSFGTANRIVAGIIGLLYLLKIFGALTHS